MDNQLKLGTMSFKYLVTKEQLEQNLPYHACVLIPCRLHRYGHDDRYLVYYIHACIFFPEVFSATDIIEHSLNLDIPSKVICDAAILNTDMGLRPIYMVYVTPMGICLSGSIPVEKINYHLMGDVDRQYNWIDICASELPNTLPTRAITQQVIEWKYQVKQSYHSDETTSFKFVIDVTNRISGFIAFLCCMEFPENKYEIGFVHLNTISSTDSRKLPLGYFKSCSPEILLASIRNFGSHVPIWDTKVITDTTTGNAVSQYVYNSGLTYINFTTMDDTPTIKTIDSNKTVLHVRDDRNVRNDGNNIILDSPLFELKSQEMINVVQGRISAMLSKNEKSIYFRDEYDDTRKIIHERYGIELLHRIFPNPSPVI